MSQVALIFGINGQDGSHMTDLLLEKGWVVHGVIRRASNFNTQRLEHVRDKITLHYGDLTDPMAVYHVIDTVRPQCVYNFAAQSHVKVSSEVSEYTLQVNTVGVLHILQAIHKVDWGIRMYQAGTSEQYGNATDGSVSLNEDSAMNPVSVYGVSKLAAQGLCRMYRDSFGMYIVSAILFNHEGPRRGGTFVTQKISKFVAGYNCTKVLELGNLDARRDWGYAKDYCKAIYEMMNRDSPKDYVIATGESHSVREFLELSLEKIGVSLEWQGKGVDEKGYNQDTGELVVEVNPRLYRDIDIECLLGDASRAKAELGWTPETSFKELVSIMTT